MKKLFSTMVIATCCIALLTGCGAKLESISLKDIVMNYGETKQLEAEYGFDKEISQEELTQAIDSLNIVYLSSDENVVTIDEKGFLTSVDGGTATVTAEHKGITTQCSVTVNVPVKDIAADETLELQINGTETANVNAKVLPANATQQKISYTSSDEEVATVDTKGNVTAKSSGECVITCEIENKTVDTNVTVTIKATGIELKSNQGWIYVGGSTTLVAYTIPAQAPASTYTYKVDNANVATVTANGVVTGKAAGTAKITVTSADGFTTLYNLTVKTKPVATTTTNGGTTNTSGGSTTSSSGGTTTVTPEYVAPTPEPTPPPSVQNPIDSGWVTPGDGTGGGMAGGD